MIGSKPKHEITVVIGTDGHVTGEVKGVSGPACGPLSEWLNKLGEVTRDCCTSDYYKPGEQGVQVNH
jgi:hypothetical protein